MVSLTLPVISSTGGELVIGGRFTSASIFGGVTSTLGGVTSTFTGGLDSSLPLPPPDPPVPLPELPDSAGGWFLAGGVGLGAGGGLGCGLGDGWVGDPLEWPPEPPVGVSGPLADLWG